MTAGADDRLRTGSLRWRVVSWVLLLLIAVLTALGVLVVVLLRQALIGDLRTRLEDRAGFAALLHEQGMTGQELADNVTGGGVLATVASGDHRYVGTDRGRPGGPGRPGLPPRPAAHPTVTYRQSDGDLVATVGLTSGTLELRTSEAEIDRTITQLTRIELIAGTGTVLITAGGLWVVVGRALHPLRRLSLVATRIRDGARGRRLRPTRPQTDLGRAAGSFDEMLDALESAETAAQQAELVMRQFVADASHDLRTPLAGVIVGAERVLRAPLCRAERETQLVAVVRQARRASRLVDDLLLITRLDVPVDATPARRPIDAMAAVGAEVEALRLRRPDLALRIAGPAGVLAWVDPDQFARAVGNLLDNAAAAGGPIDVTLSCDDRTITVIVQDHGPGVPPQERQRIFDRFVRLADARSGSGSGLGLPIARAVARAHGGDVRCLPAEVGARFVLTIPVAVPVAPTESVDGGVPPEAVLASV